MGFSRQEYWSGLLFPSPGDLPNPGIEPGSPALQVDSLPLSHQGFLGDLTVEIYFPSIWRPEVQDQGVGTVDSSCDWEGGSVPDTHLPSFGGLGLLGI